MNAYCLAAGVMAIDLPITAVAAGLAGDVLSNTITLLASAVPGIDFVNNQSATMGGMDPESDATFRSRFASFFAARSRATIDAIGYAITLVNPELNYVILENVDAIGDTRPGNILIIVNDGSGTVTDLLFESLSVAIAAVRPVGTSFSIQPPQLTEVQVSLSVECPPELSISTVQSLLQPTIENYINSHGIGTGLSVTRISQLVYRTEPRITNVSNVMLNGQLLDLISQPTGAFQCSNLIFT